MCEWCECVMEIVKKLKIIELLFWFNSVTVQGRIQGVARVSWDTVRFLRSSYSLLIKLGLYKDEAIVSYQYKRPKYFKFKQNILSSLHLTHCYLIFTKIEK
jgi:hypothetical protein